VARTTAGTRKSARTGIPKRLPLVGRDSGILLLDQTLDVVEQGQLRVVLLLGDPGMGKTRLAAEVAARRHDIVTLSARAYPLGTTAALGLWVEALERHLRTLDGGTSSRWLASLPTILRWFFRPSAQPSAIAAPVARPAFACSPLSPTCWPP
jgi:hypothetical protein